MLLRLVAGQVEVDWNCEGVVDEAISTAGKDRVDRTDRRGERLKKGGVVLIRD